MDKELKALHANWNYPTDIRFGAGRINELAEVCKTLGITHPLLVTDAGLVKLDIVKNVISDTSAKGIMIEIFGEVKPNPSGENINRGVKEYKRLGCDGVVAFGGGSGLDAGKAIALMVGQKESIWSYEDIGNNWEKINADGIAPCIAIPTTSGTGSEVGRASVIVDESSQKKKIIFHPGMLPMVVIADATLTEGLPSEITAATGLDAFVHSLEAYCAPGYHPMADGIAIESMRLIKDWLYEAVKHGDNLIARSHMLVASTMGATAFQKGLGGVHALAHPLGAIYDKHHGLLNAILLPYVLLKNKFYIEKKIKNIAICIGVSESHNIDNSYDDFMKWVLEFREKLGIPEKLLDIGIDAEKSQQVAEMAINDPTAATNPVLFSVEQYKEIFENAVYGKLK